MTEPSPLDRQLADVLWLVATALRAGYDERQAVDHIAGLGIEPGASALVQLLELFDNRDDVPNDAVYFDQVAARLRAGCLDPADLATELEALGTKILADVGTDEAFYPEMRVASLNLGVTLPARANVPV